MRKSIAGLLGLAGVVIAGVTGLSAPSQAAPVPQAVATAVPAAAVVPAVFEPGQSGAVVEQVQYYRRPYYGRGYYHRPHFFRRPYYRGRYYGRPYWRR
jgi:hypothetical protein